MAQLIVQPRFVFAGQHPDRVEVKPVILVDHDVPLTDHIAPRNLGMSLAEPVGYGTRGFTKQSQVVRDRLLGDPVDEESLLVPVS